MVCGRWRPVGNDDAPARMARGNRYSSFLFFFFSSSSSSSLFLPQSTVDGRFLPQSIADGRFLTEPPGSGRSTYQQPNGLVCTARTRRYKSKLQTLLGTYHTDS
ncbi:hypothetical protein BHM03_00010163 [Ensete ventricosum]|nr:hypothetical protein BHM03_00010163 [Ensete ventricosum]